LGADTGSIADRIRKLQAELDAEIARRSADLRFGLEKGRAIFEEEVARRHRELKTGLWRYIRQSNVLIILTAPFIYMLIIPFVLLDLFLFVYQAVCFRVYRIPRVRRADYFVFDRRYLAYLNLIEKLNCAYCSYGNGVIAYAREVGSVTEQYWCPIKHARRTQDAHARYLNFVDFGDADAYLKKLPQLRDEVRKSSAPAP
jgi:hypothetical protein